MNKPLKYIGHNIVFQEIPNEITLAINISGCPHRCEDCHSKYLWEYEGKYLKDDIENLLNKYKYYISCVCFMGGEQNIDELVKFVSLLKSCGLKAAIYTGASEDEIITKLKNIGMDYIKYGEYIKKFGALNSANTNQKMIMKTNDIWIDITYIFKRRII